MDAWHLVQHNSHGPQVLHETRRNIPRRIAPHHPPVEGIGHFKRHDVRSRQLRPSSSHRRVRAVALSEHSSSTSPYTPNLNLNVKVLDFVKYGGAEGTRTPDFLRAKEALSHLSYSPTPDVSID